VGNYRHHDRRVLPFIGLALAGVFLASGSIAATQQIAVQVAFVETVEISVPDSRESGTAAQNLAIKSSPGRKFSILIDPDTEDITVSYQ
jgi:hypothetical protein